MLSFEYINKNNYRRVYFRFDKKELLVNEQIFINSMDVTISEKEIEKQAKFFKDTTKRKENKVIDIKDAKRLKKNELESKEKKEKGKKRFERFISDIEKFIAEKIKEVENVNT